MKIAFTRATTEPTNTVFLSKIYLNEGYLPDETSLQSHKSSTSNVNHSIQQKKHPPTLTELTKSKVLRPKLNSVFLESIEAGKDADISCTSYALSTCKNKRNYEY